MMPKCTSIKDQMLGGTDVPGWLVSGGRELGRRLSRSAKGQLTGRVVALQFAERRNADSAGDAHKGAQYKDA